MGIEPTLAAWEAAVLPLNYTRGGSQCSASDATRNRRPRPRGAVDQNALPTVANTLASLPMPCSVVTLAPRFASKPNSCVRAPNCRVR